MHRLFRRERLVRAVFTSLAAFSAASASAAGPLPAETCEQIRTLIDLLPPANGDLLRKLAVRKECGFTSAEVYRAAYGDRPVAREVPDRRRHRKHDDDD